MRRKRVTYREGDWFAVPLRGSAGFAAGVVARMDGQGVIVGYFFGPKYATSPALPQVERDRPAGSILQARFGDLGLLRGEWPLLGQTKGRWARRNWPMPEFVRTDAISGVARRVRYSDENLRREVAVLPVDENQVPSLPSDGLKGYGAVEIRLSKLLAS